MMRAVVPADALTGTAALILFDFILLSEMQ